jgi:hypothetical protein
MTCSRVSTHLCDCKHAGVEFRTFATTKTSGEAVCAATDRSLCLLKIHGDKVFHRVMKFCIMYKFLEAEAELGPGKKKV